MLQPVVERGRVPPVPQGGLGLVPGELRVASQQGVGVEPAERRDRAAEPDRGGGEQPPQGGAPSDRGNVAVQQPQGQAHRRLLPAAAGAWSYREAITPPSRSATTARLSLRLVVSSPPSTVRL